MGIAVIVEPSIVMFAAGWGLQRLWRHLAAVLQREGGGRFAAGWGVQYGRFAAGLDWSNCGAT